MLGAPTPVGRLLDLGAVRLEPAPGFQEDKSGINVQKGLDIFEVVRGF